MGRLRVAIVQFGAFRSKAQSLEKIRRLLERYDGKPDLIVFPEYSMLDPTGLSAEAIWQAAESLEGPWLQEFASIAESFSSCVVATLFERSQRPPLSYNTVAVLGRSGEILGTYRKTQLFDALGYKESSIMMAGDRLFEPVEACGAKLGVAVCFELRYPEIFRVQALLGADLVAVPAAWYRGPLKEEALRALTQARAQENGIFMMIASQYGENFVGRSMIADPMGVIIAEGGIGEKVIEAEVDLEDIKRARERLPLLELARWDLLISSMEEAAREARARR